MTIDKAVIIAIAENKYMKRSEWTLTKLKPKRGMAVTIIRSDGSSPQYGWHPTAEELAADDWVVVD